MSAVAAEAWFHNGVVDGLQLLYTLNLPDRPAAEVLTLTALTWVEVLWRTRPWVEALDARRLPAAFTSLAAVADRWPSPKQLVVHLPPRGSQPALPPMRGSRPSSEVRAKLDELTAVLRQRRWLAADGKATPLVRGTFAAPQRPDEEPGEGQSRAGETS